MDKYERRVLAEEVSTLISEHKYTEATQLADTLDWENVQSVRILCRVSDLYKYNRRYEDSRDVLEYAYRRCPKNRQILYSMCELELKLGNYIRALQLYNAYINVAPTDSGRYVLKYKLYREQNVSLPEQIAVLEELARHDFPERWSYELAHLYHKAGRDRDCADMCDEIAAFFGNGRYVDKALALKKSVLGIADKADGTKENTRPAGRLSDTKTQQPDSNMDLQQTARWTQESVQTAAQSGGATGVWSSDAVRRAQEENRREYNFPQESQQETQKTQEIRKPRQESREPQQENREPQQEIRDPQQENRELQQEIREPQKTDDYEVRIDDSVFSDEQLTETVAEGMRDLYDSEKTDTQQEQENAETSFSTTRSWDLQEIREAEEKQERGSGHGAAVREDTNGIDPEGGIDPDEDEPEPPGDMELMAYAQEYAAKQGYEIDSSGLEALEERIAQMRDKGYQVVQEDIRDMIGEAIYYSGIGLYGRSTGTSSTTKHGSRGDTVLRDKDFIHY